MASTQTRDSATDQVKQRAGQAGEQAKGAAEQAKSRVSEEVDKRSTQAGEQATSVADAVRQASRQLREQGKEGVAKPMEQAAERVESAGNWLREADGDRILREVEDFGRRQPMVALAGGLAIGFALSRLLKASSVQRHEASGAADSRRGDGRESRELPPRTGLPPRTSPAGGPITPPGAGVPPRGPGATEY
jgi:hypothetical protein